MTDSAKALIAEARETYEESLSHPHMMVPKCVPALADLAEKALEVVEAQREVLENVVEWTAKFPLKGAASDFDRSVAAEIYERGRAALKKGGF